MRYLLDSCIWIFLLKNDVKLKQKQKSAILNTQNTIYISVVSVWEISIKIEKKKLTLPKPLKSLIFEACVKDNYKILDLDVFSVLNTKNLPNHHKDPFDRMLIAQAIDNDLTIITYDSKFFDYDVKVLNS
ncbi:MAG: type II toxin-antitoxin system VapC family toxin [Xenococcus sp. (in: cyanobacteria)]